MLGILRNRPEIICDGLGARNIHFSTLRIKCDRLFIRDDCFHAFGVFSTIVFDDLLELSGVGLCRVQIVDLKSTPFKKGLPLRN